MKPRISNRIATGALIAALYVVFTYTSSLFGLSSGVIQLRISEALCVLPLWISGSVTGLFIGCILANLLTGAVLWDVIFGSLATLIAAIITSKMKRCKWCAPIPAIVSNTIVVPLVLFYVYQVPDSLPYIFLTVFIGEFLSAGVLGWTVIYIREKRYKKQK